MKMTWFKNVEFKYRIILAVENPVSTSEENLWSFVKFTILM